MAFKWGISIYLNTTFNKREFLLQTLDSELLTGQGLQVLNLLYHFAYIGIAYLAFRPLVLTRNKSHITFNPPTFRCHNPHFAYFDHI